MTATKFVTLGDAVLDEHFPAVDLALRRGRHVDRDDAEWFGFLRDAEDVLEPFYRRYGAELVYRADGYYYLLPSGDKLAKRQLGLAEMLVGQALTLLYLDPTSVEQGGRVTREQVLAHLATVMGTDALIRALNPKRRRYDERVAQETVRARVADALRRLAALGFVEALGAEEFKLRPALLRFAEPVRASADSAEALSRLVASGEVAFAAEEPATEVAENGPDSNDDAGEPTSTDATAEIDPSETDPNETDPSETDPSETDPSETDPSETDPSEIDPNETDPNETDPNETDPSETDPSEIDPSEFDDLGFEDVEAGTEVKEDDESGVLE